jgi:anion-transporting  ArsA/GET3 family ATPase
VSAPVAARAWALDALLDDPATHTLVCAGSGGVGKTTTAAALALRAAERGRRVVVLTVDPSRRLAQALGLGAGSAEPREVAGVDLATGGSLHAAVLDARATLDAMVDAALEPQRAADLKRNPVYASVAGSFSGTQEYMAMERLGQLHAQGASGAAPWDLVVVDTPPSRSALDFIDAPARLGRFLDGRFVRLLRSPPRPRAGLAGLAGRVTGGIAAVMHRVVGARLLRDVQALVQGLDVVFGGFQERARATSAALAAPGSAFVVVTAAEADALAEAGYLLARLARDSLPTAALVVNRATVLAPALAGLSAQAATAAAARVTGEPVAALLRLHAELALTAAAEARRVAALLDGHPQVAVATAAARVGDVHDVAGLREVAADLART